jgi:hypothetical protein
MLMALSLKSWLVISVNREDLPQKSMVRGCFAGAKARSLFQQSFGTAEAIP